jgi:hypothetical protein
VTAIKTASNKVGTCSIIFVFIVALRGRRGDTEQVVARWRRPVASSEALVMLHWVMSSVLHRHTAMAIEIACNGGAFVRCRRLF